MYNEITQLKQTATSHDTLYQEKDEQSVSAYQISQDKTLKLETDLNAAQSQLFPLRKEVAKIGRENHMLRVESLRLKDSDLVSTFT